MKNSTPAVLVYYEDLLSGTDYMTDEEFGQYIRLLMRQNIVGHMSDEYLRRIHVDHIYKVVAEKFVRDEDGKLYNKRMEEEIKRRVNYSRSRQQNRSSKNEDKHMSEHMLEHMSEHMSGHMVTETETVTETTDRNNKVSATAESVISHLNNQTGKRYRPSSRQVQSKISARLNEGFTLEDFIRVIDIKSAEWMGTDMEKYLRPETLFGPKFESYLNQRQVRREMSNQEIAMMLDEAERRSREQDTGWSNAGEGISVLPEHIQGNG